MERDVTRFLKQIVQTITAGLIWLFINMSAGIYGGWMFYNGLPGIGNIIFYGWLIISFGVLLRYIYKTWKDDFTAGHREY